MENEFDFWILHIKIRLYKNFHENLRKIFDSFFKPFLTNQGKNEDEDEKILEHEFDFWSIHIKIRLHGNFYEYLLKKVLSHFLHFWLIEAKMKMKMKKYGKMFSIFKFSISKLGYVVIFTKIEENDFWFNF